MYSDTCTAKENLGSGDEMLQKSPSHLVQRPYHQGRNVSRREASHWPIRSSIDHCGKEQIEVVRTYVKIVRATAKTNLQGTIQGGRKRGRQRKGWKDNIKERTDLSFAETQRLAKMERAIKRG